MDDLNDPMAKWRDLVGGFILAFGDIELITFRLWRNYVPERPAPHNCLSERQSLARGKDPDLSS